MCVLSPIRGAVPLFFHELEKPNLCGSAGGDAGSHDERKTESEEAVERQVCSGVWLSASGGEEWRGIPWGRGGFASQVRWRVVV